MLANAGVLFQTVPPNIDELSLQAQLTRHPAEMQATVLATSKAQSLTAQYPDRYVIGSDQILEVDGIVLHKAGTLPAAKQQLQCLAGKVHRLHTAVAVILNGKTVFNHVATPSLHMRRLSDNAVNNYLHLEGNDVLSSVGCYRLEGRGIQLFDRMEGDYFTILGLPLLPLLNFLRHKGLMPS
jgi:septum formation protein